MFPRHIWAKYLATSESSEYEDHDYGHIKGDSTARSAICDYVFRAKGIQCSPEQIVIVSGATEGFLLLAKSLSSKFHSIYIEDPTIDITRDIFRR